MAGPGPDTTLLWTLERLTAENLSHDTLIILLRELKQVHGDALHLPEDLKVRIVLNSLNGADTVNASLLLELKTLQEMAKSSEETVIVALKDSLSPPHELMLQVKTELVAQTWRNSIAWSPRLIKERIFSTFGNPCPPEDRAKMEELLAATGNPAVKLAIDRQVDGDVALQGVKRFAATAIQAMPPTLLSAINEDINAGLYRPGEMGAVIDAVRAEAHAQMGAVMDAVRAEAQAQMIPAAFAMHRVSPAAAPVPVPVIAAAPAPVPVVAAPRITPVAASPYAAFPRADEFAPAPGGDDREESPGATAAKRLRLEGQFDALRDARGGLLAAGGADPLHNAAAIAAVVAGTVVAERMGALPPGSAARLEQRLASPDAGLPAALPALPLAAPAAVPPLQRAGTSPVARAPARPAAGFTARRAKRPWSEEEVRALLDGAREHRKSWSKIHQANLRLWGPPAPGEKPLRTQVDLKDKWRNLVGQRHPEALDIEHYLATTVDERERRPGRRTAAEVAAAAAEAEAAPAQIFGDDGEDEQGGEGAGGEGQDGDAQGDEGQEADAEMGDAQGGDAEMEDAPAPTEEQNGGDDGSDSSDSSDSSDDSDEEAEEEEEGGGETESAGEGGGVEEAAAAEVQEEEEIEVEPQPRRKRSAQQPEPKETAKTATRQRQDKPATRGRRRKSKRTANK